MGRSLFCYRKEMSNVETLGVNYDEAFTNVSEPLAGLERAVNAALLTLFPDRDMLAAVAVDAKQRIDVDGIEVNAIVRGKQITLVAEPGQPMRITIRDKDSLCVLTVGANKTLWIEDIKNSEFLDAHGLSDDSAKWGAWASAPIRVFSSPVGTVCAVNREAREWSEEDKQVLESLAKLVGDAVENWSKNSTQEDGTDAA